MDQETQARFDGVDARFEDVYVRMDARFDQVNARFDALEALLAWQFERNDRRFDALEARMADVEARLAGLEAGLRLADARFAAIDERFLSMSERFTNLETRLEQLRGQFATSLGDLDARVGVLGGELNERLDRVAAAHDPALLDRLRERVTLIADRVDHLATSVVPRLEKVELALNALGTRVDDISDDMRQRFRVVSDHLAEIDRRLAA